MCQFATKLALGLTLDSPHLTICTHALKQFRRQMQPHLRAQSFLHFCSSPPRSYPYSSADSHVMHIVLSHRSCYQKMSHEKAPGTKNHGFRGARGQGVFSPDWRWRSLRPRCLFFVHHKEEQLLSPPCGFLVFAHYNKKV